MTKTFNLTIRTPESEIFNNQAKSIKLFTDQGLIKILPNHASLTASISYSPIIVKDSNGIEHDYTARRGILQISNPKNSVSLMFFECTLTKELDPMSIQEYLQFVETELSKGNDLSEFKLAYLKHEKVIIEKLVKTQKIQP